MSPEFLQAIRERDAQDPPGFTHCVTDRRALLAYVDELGAQFEDYISDRLALLTRAEAAEARVRELEAGISCALQLLAAKEPAVVPPAAYTALLELVIAEVRAVLAKGGAT
jgi:hypothetical protein